MRAQRSVLRFGGNGLRVDRVCKSASATRVHGLAVMARASHRGRLTARHVKVPERSLTNNAVDSPTVRHSDSVRVVVKEWKPKLAKLYVASADVTPLGRHAQLGDVGFPNAWSEPLFISIIYPNRTFNQPETNLVIAEGSAVPTARDREPHHLPEAARLDSDWLSLTDRGSALGEKLCGRSGCMPGGRMAAVHP